MEQYIPKSALVSEIKRLDTLYHTSKDLSGDLFIQGLFCFLDTIEVKEVDLELELANYNREYVDENGFFDTEHLAKHFFEIGLQARHDNWKVVDNTNHPQEDRTKIYCVFTKQRYILAKVISHPQDDDLLQWKCTEFPNHRYDMCEGDKYMQIV